MSFNANVPHNHLLVKPQFLVQEYSGLFEGQTGKFSLVFLLALLIIPVVAIKNLTLARRTKVRLLRLWAQFNLVLSSVFVLAVVVPFFVSLFYEDGRPDYPKVVIVSALIAYLMGALSVVSSPLLLMVQLIMLRFWQESDSSDTNAKE